MASTETRSGAGARRSVTIVVTMVTHYLAAEKFRVNCALLLDFLFNGTAGDVLCHAGRTLSSVWSVNSFTMVVYENIFIHVLDRKFLLKLKRILIDNHYKTIYGLVGPECSSCRVLFNIARNYAQYGFQVHNSL